MQYSFLLALVIVLIIAWAAYDRVIYHGFAAVRLDDDSRKRKSGARAVAVLPPLHLGLHARVVRGLVSKAKADQIVWTPNAKRMVVLRQRLFGKVRVTKID